MDQTVIDVRLPAAAEDCSSPEHLVQAAYRYISFEAGREPDWVAFKSLFAPVSSLALRLFPGDEDLSILTLEEYVVQQVTQAMKTSGYEERPVSTVHRRSGSIAEARVDFLMIYGPDKVYDATDVFQMVKKDGRWWIVSILGEVMPSPQLATLVKE